MAGMIVLPRTFIVTAPARSRDPAAPADLHHQTVLDEQRGHVDDPAIADDDAGAVEEQGTAIVLPGLAGLAIGHYTSGETSGRMPTQRLSLFTERSFLVAAVAVGRTL